MSQRERGRVLGVTRGRIAQLAECGANGALAGDKTASKFDTARSRSNRNRGHERLAACCLSRRLASRTSTNYQRTRTGVGSCPTTRCYRSDRSHLCVVDCCRTHAVREPLSAASAFPSYPRKWPFRDQIANALAMRTGGQLQLRLLGLDLLVRAPHPHDSPSNSHMRAIVGADRRVAFRKNGGGVRCLRQKVRGRGVQKPCGAAGNRSGRINGAIKPSTSDDNSVRINPKVRPERGP